MNLTELSKKTGFSVSTLSKAFNNSDEIPKATKEKIYDLAKQYGCLNRYLKQHYDNKVIAVIVPETDSE
ncbi:MAG: helix-turn-helix domain-containing protein, partial [Clostridia bacterium]|nr:helix-turn-helix domain-containing protein [Clostridia bacterium]